MDEEIKKAERGANLVKEVTIALLILTGVFIMTGILFGYPPTVAWILSPLWVPLAVIVASVVGLMTAYITLIILYNVAEWLKNLGKKD